MNDEKILTSNLRNKLIEGKTNIRKSIKENSPFKTDKFMHILADLIEYILITETVDNTTFIDNELILKAFDKTNQENLKSIESNLNNTYNAKFVQMGFDSIDDFLDKLETDIFIVNKDMVSNLDDDLKMKLDDETRIEINHNIKKYLQDLINKYKCEQRSMIDSLSNLMDNFILDLENIKREME